jgi:hypothetical protein
MIKREGTTVGKYRSTSFLFILTLISFFHFGPYVACSTAQEVPKSQLPAIITSCGQSPDAFMVKVLCDRVKVKVSYEPLLEAKDIKNFKTLLIVMGGSSKGLGDAGFDEKDELDRVRGLLAKAKDMKVLIFGIHVGGEPRRGPLSVKFIDLVAPRSDDLIISEDGNKDGYFTKVSKAKKIPLQVIKETRELGDLLKKIFQVK